MTPTPTANRTPTISISGSGSFGIAQQTGFTFTATASDPDGDPVTVAWSLGDGTATSGLVATKTYNAGGTMTIVATVADNRGASAPSAPLTVTIGSMAGQWAGTVNLNSCLPGVVKPVAATLNQSGTTVTGTVTLSQGLCSFAPGSALTDPAEPGTINGVGAVRFRVKIPPFTDVYFQGQMDTTGRTITGGLQGSGHSGTPFTLNKQ